jgi:exonuclease III
MVFMDNTNHHYKLLSWNVRGMNNVARREKLRQMISIYNLDLVCFQETKMTIITLAIVRTFVELDYADNFMYHPAEGTRGSIVIAAKESLFHLHDPVISNHSATIVVIDLRPNVNWDVHWSLWATG